MKKHISTFVILVLFSFPSFSQNGISWSSPVEVTGSMDGKRPRIELLPDNTPVLIWSKYGTSDKDYFFSKWDNTDFLAPMQLNDTPLLTYDWGGTELVADGNTLYTIMKEGPDVYAGRVYIRKSTDGGATWGTKTLIEDATGEITMYPNVYAYNDSVVLVTYMTHENGGANPQYVGRTSVDGGATFSSPVAISESFGDEACYCCPSAIAANENYQAVAFRNDASSIRDIKAGISTDNGISFATQVSLDDNSWYFPSCPSSGPDLALNNSDLYSTYMSKGSGDEMIYLVHDDLSDANSFSSMTAMPDTIADLMNFPEMDNLGDTLAVVWQITKSGQTYLWYNITLNGMSEWAPENARAVFPNTADLVKPDIAIGSDHSIHLVYIDQMTNMVMYTTGTFSLASNDELTAESVQVYPNPASNQLFIANIPTNSDFEISDLNGKVLLIGNGNQADISSLTSGVYFIQVEGLQTSKFVVR